MNADSQDVTSLVRFSHHSVDCDENEGEYLPLRKCVCGAKFDYLEMVLGSNPDSPWSCPTCGAKLFFEARIRVYRIKSDVSS